MLVWSVLILVEPHRLILEALQHVTSPRWFDLHLLLTFRNMREVSKLSLAASNTCISLGGGGSA